MSFYVLDYVLIIPVVKKDREKNLLGKVSCQGVRWHEVGEGREEGLPRRGMTLRIA